MKSDKHNPAIGASLVDAVRNPLESASQESFAKARGGKVKIQYLKIMHKLLYGNQSSIKEMIRVEHKNESLEAVEALMGRGHIQVDPHEHWVQTRPRTSLRRR